MVLGGQPPGRVGRRRDFSSPAPSGGPVRGPGRTAAEGAGAAYVDVGPWLCAASACPAVVAGRLVSGQELVDAAGPCRPPAARRLPRQRPPALRLPGRPGRQRSGRPGSAAVVRAAAGSRASSGLRRAGHGAIARPARADTRCRPSSAASSDETLMSRSFTATRPQTKVAVAEGEEPAVGAGRRRLPPERQAGEADDEAHDVVQRVGLEAEQALVGVPPGEVVEAGDQEAGQAAQGEGGADRQGEPPARCLAAVPASAGTGPRACWG